MRIYTSQQTSAKDKEIAELKAEIDRLKKEVERLQNQNDNKEQEPYFGWCDVDGCDGEGCSGGNVWRETGYWTVCIQHSSDYRNGLPQPKMKQSAIDRENNRDKKTGVLIPQTQ